MSGHIVNSKNCLLIFPNLQVTWLVLLQPDSHITRLHTQSAWSWCHHQRSNKMNGLLFTILTSFRASPVCLHLLQLHKMFAHSLALTLYWTIRWWLNVCVHKKELTRSGKTLNKLPKTPLCRELFCFFKFWMYSVLSSFFPPAPCSCPILFIRFSFPTFLVSPVTCVDQSATSANHVLSRFCSLSPQFASI